MYIHYRDFLLAAMLALASVIVVSADDKTILPDSSLVKSGLLMGDTLRGDNMQRGHMTTALDALQGRTAGVTVGNNSNQEAMLSSVRVRGNTSLTGGNEPLVIIDGMSSDLRTLASIYPADIESFTILKDAAQTAQYGSRASAGVIEVKTKRGSAARFSVGYSGDVGFSHADKFLPVMTGDEYRDLTHRLGLSIVDHGSDTDWQRSVLRTGFVQNHHVAISGGSEQSQYRASVSFSQNNTIVKTIGNRNLTAKLDVTQHAFDKRMTIDLGVFGATQWNTYINDEQKLFYSSAAFNPTFPLGKNADGGWTGYTDASQINHPQSLLDIEKHSDELHFNMHLRINGNLGKGFSLSAYGSYSYDVNDQRYFYPTYIESTGKIYRGAGKEQAWLANVRAGYKFNNGRHLVEASLLGEMQGVTRTGFHTTVNKLASNAFGYDNLSVGAMRMWQGTGSEYERQHLVSVMGQVGYTALGRYNLSVTARADASSLAGSNHKWGFFPSVSVSWDISKEKFMEPANRWLSRLSVRAGYGITGNLSGIKAYQSLLLLAPEGIIETSDGEVVTMGITRNANPDLRWEKSSTVSAGLDFGVLNNRILFNAGYYYSHITDMLYNYEVSVPPFLYDHLLANLGQMENTGLEFGLGIAAVQTKDFSLNISANLAWQRNRLLSLNGWYEDQYLTAPEYTPIAGLNGAGLHGGDADVVYQIVGQPLGVFYLPHCTGLSRQEDGTYRYEIADIDGKKGISMSDGGDRQVCGQATPKVLLGSNISFRYKQLDLSVQLNGAFGHKIFNGTALSYMNIGSLPYYNIFRRAETNNIKDLTVSDYWLEKGDYVNIDYITLGWNMPIEKWVHRKTDTSNERPARRLPSLRLSLSVNNVATISGYSGLTPMINSSVINGTLGIDDKRTWPVARTYSFSISVQL
ncbi:MAG: SusC/RagA family TonB-linked outer membrane protein [Paludibacteraceae bacterium]|nr:SusC/RagA family TonB-linked outer membrane protein [Paludibacteraceae bacterium]